MCQIVCVKWDSIQVECDIEKNMSVEIEYSLAIKMNMIPSLT